jgi:Domain of unknown function (DUF6429)
MHVHEHPYEPTGRVALPCDQISTPAGFIPIALGAVRANLSTIGRARFAMPLNTDKIDDAALALLYLTLHDGYRAWKGFDWDVLDRLHQKGMIDNPVSKTKSVVFTEEGLERAKKLFATMFES